MSYKNEFIKIEHIESKNANSSIRSLLENLILGVENKGFDINPPFEALSWRSWSTRSSTNKLDNYFDEYKEPIVIDLYLSKEEEFDAIGIWPSRYSIGNSIRDFTIEFSTDGSNESFSKPLTKRAINTNPHDLEIFSFKKVKTNIVRIKILSNFSHLNIKGNRVNFREITIIRNYRKIKKAIIESKSNACNFDFVKNLLDNKIDDEYNILNIRPEFSLDNIWKPNFKYKDFLKARGFYSRGVQLRRIDLSKWADKIYTHHFLKENEIKGMPIVHYSLYLNDDFIDKVKELYLDGMKSFVIKMNHLAYGRGIFRVKDGYFISSNFHDKSKKIVNKEVDFEFLNNQIKKFWNDQQFTEEWACNVLSPGVILEELIDDSVELKFSFVFGELVGFFMENPDLPSYNKYGQALKNTKHQLPFWWKEASIKASNVAQLVRADHIRIDMFYYKGEVIVCEITWNGIEMPEYHNEIAKKLNSGYMLRKQYLDKSGQI